MTTLVLLVPMTQYEIKLIYSLLPFMTMMFRNSIQDGKKFYLSMSKIPSDDILESLYKLEYGSPRNSKPYWNCMTETFRVTGDHDTVLDYADLFSITFRDDTVQDFDTRWDEMVGDAVHPSLRREFRRVSGSSSEGHDSEGEEGRKTGEVCERDRVEVLCDKCGNIWNMTLGRQTTYDTPRQTT